MHEKYMGESLKQASKAFERGEMPVGVIIVHKDKIISRGYNKKELKKDSTMHAEIIAIRRASKKIGDWRLNECVMYVTMEPCIMCLGAIKESRIKKIYCGVKNKTYNEVNKKIIDTYNLNVEYGILKLEIQKQLKSFFKIIRNK